MPTSKKSVVLVAGGAGFVGSAIVRRLIKSGARVVSFDNYFYGSPIHLQGLGNRLACIQGDVRRSNDLVAALRDYRVDFVINAVGDTFVPDAYDAPEQNQGSSPNQRVHRKGHRDESENLSQNP